MCMTEHGDVPIVGLPAKLPLHMADDEPCAVVSRVTHGWLIDLSDEREAGSQANFIALVITKASHQRAIQLSQRRNSKRRDQIAREKDYVTLPLR